jgi:preprotein translocase subunit YajC
VPFLIIIVLLLVFMWFFVVLPGRRRQAQQKAMFDNLKPGDEVLTAGGLYGDITEVGEDEVAMEIAPGVEVRIATKAIATIIPPDAYEDDEATDEVEGVEEAADEAEEATDEAEEPEGALARSETPAGDEHEALPERSAEPPAEAQPR